MFAQGLPRIDLETASSLQSAIDALRRTIFDLVISETELPDSSGMDTLRALQAASPSLPIILLSSEDQNPETARALQESAEDYLVKDQFDTRLLQRSIRYAVERKKLSLENLHLRHEAERLSHDRDEFVAILSHELRTPLQGILGWAVLLRDGRMSPGNAERALASIEQNAREQDRIIEDLVDMSRILSGKLTLDIAPIELGSVVQSSMDAVRLAAESKQVTIGFEVPSAIPPVTADARRLQQALRNVLTHSVRFTPREGRVQITLKCSASEAEILVRDNGNGISAKALPHVFERFRHTEGITARGHAGFGIGLSIAYHLLEQHGGTIQVSSEGEGKGSTFSLRFPIGEKRHHL
jgi:signal transduction histidine kinase